VRDKKGTNNKLPEPIPGILKKVSYSWCFGKTDRNR